ncbi:hypothetical protein [Filimonas effusa]|uniref:Uncharacterized protein n=1 Tax=Filimonas effusa TaxID=2508721 RepID=A0A4Q1DAF2_9BACT|nr:hypothetical protein [Filimonas effusa]RXK85745.1 hypothetical protein ESB13_02720 [Filimonas effusa]
MKKKVAFYTSFLLALYGLYQLSAELYKAVNSSLITLIVVAGIIVLLIVCFELYKKHRIPYVFSLFGIKPHEGCIITDASHNISIDEDGTSRNEIRKTYLFASPPKPEQLYNTFFSIAAFNNDINSIVRYHTVKIKSFRILRKGRLVVYWEPLKKIQAHVPFLLKYEWTMPSKLNDDRNFFIFFSLKPSGTTSIVINPTRELQNAWLIRKPYFFFKKLNEENIERIILKCKSFDVEQPQIVNNTIKWKCSNLKHQTAYILYFTYKPGVQPADE